MVLTLNITAVIQKLVLVVELDNHAKAHHRNHKHGIQESDHHLWV